MRLEAMRGGFYESETLQQAQMPPRKLSPHLRQTHMSDLKSSIQAAAKAGKLLDTASDNILRMLEQGDSPVYSQSIQELADDGQWSELNDRFYRTLAFGTGGLRGRTIGKVITNAEHGCPQKFDRPEQPCVGTNAMNYFNISRATQGLVAYLKEWFVKENRTGKPKIVIAHDTRHFSRDFAELAARVAVENGCDAGLFEAPRSTPELSFAVRHTGATAGIVITASHNPPHDNGYKVYFEDGGQLVEPHASGVITKVNAVRSGAYEPLSPNLQGRLETLGAEIDEAFMKRMETLVLDRALVEKQRDLRIVFTPIHGTGGKIIKPLLSRFGFQYSTVPEQETEDGRFPTVKSPNPENAEALSMAIALAEKEKADLVVATDPDADRMGVAIRVLSGGMKLLSGNQIGSLMAYYRTRTLFEKGILTGANAQRAVIIKTLVTTDLQKAIAEKFGMRCVETLTGFKYIGQKLAKYEAALPEAARRDYRKLPEEKTRELRLTHSSFYVFGGEESYGYSGADFAHDKDANGSAIMFAEVAAYAKSKGITVEELLDEIYAEFGFYLETSNSLTLEGAEGAMKIQTLIESYAKRAPKQIDGAAVVEIKDFATQTFRDVEGDALPAEKMLMFLLADGRRVAVRPSGTEPKIKFYMFAHRDPPPGATFSRNELAAVKKAVQGSLDGLWGWLKKDADERLA
jgi:phosphoglucomutase